MLSKEGNWKIIYGYIKGIIKKKELDEEYRKAERQEQEIRKKERLLVGKNTALPAEETDL